MVWLQFIVSAAVVVLAAIKLAQYGDVIAVRTRLSGMFIGTLLLAGATSLPELLSAINALAIDIPNLAAGSMFGSSMFNMFMLAILDITLPGSPDGEIVDLVVANGSFNLMLHKEKVLAEIYRVLKPDGQLAIADLIRTGEIALVDGGIENAWVWCVAGSLSASEYDSLLRTVGFSQWRLSIKWTCEPLAGAHLLARKGSA